MRHKAILHRIMKNVKPPSFAYEFESVLFKEVCLAGFFENCSSLATLVLTTGSTVNVTDSTLKRRQQLGLPPLPCFDSTEIKKLVKNTSASRRLEEKR